VWTHYETSMPLMSGQQVIWSYHPQWRRRAIYLVAAEVVQAGRLRVRIRVQTASGQVLLRWVRPGDLRLRQPDEPACPYPQLPSER
jgi:hypothetical protein